MSSAKNVYIGVHPINIETIEQLKPHSHSHAINS